MRVYVGTSGYQYDFWRGSFYSEKCPKTDMLREYAQQLGSVEVNNTFYRMPKSDVLAKWASQVPDGFRFTLKASRRITHIKRLKEPGEPIDWLFGSARALGDRLGPVLFQLPPNLKRDDERLAAFLACLPEGALATVEFRHETWFDEATYAQLRARGVALCISDEGEGEKATPLVATTGWGYLRLRRESYTDGELAEIGDKIAAQSWSEVYAYFKHEQGGPALARRLRGMLDVKVTP
jgi:uncharacterized protein YecE (DUF72 family)